MARVFQKYVAPNSEPIQTKQTEVKIDEEPEKPKDIVDISKTLRGHHALRLADMIGQSPRTRTGEPQVDKEDVDPDAALVQPLYWLMKGLRGMMQIASSAK